MVGMMVGEELIGVVLEGTRQVGKVWKCTQLAATATARPVPSLAVETFTYSTGFGRFKKQWNSVSYTSCITIGFSHHFHPNSADRKHSTNSTYLVQRLEFSTLRRALVQTSLKRVQARNKVANRLKVFTIRSMRLAFRLTRVVRTQHEPTRVKRNLPEVRSQLGVRVPVVRAELEGRILRRAKVSERVYGDKDLTNAVLVIARRPQSHLRGKIVADSQDDARNVCGDWAR
jgi:hypothetical protein